MNKFYLLMLGSGIAVGVSAQTVSKKMIEYPKTKKGTVTDSYYGTKVSDPYRWLEDDRAADTKEWVSAENKVTQAYLSKIPYLNSIKNRLKELMNYERYSAPFKEGDYIYFSKNDGLQNQSVVYRQKDGLQEVFLDPNTFSKDGTTSLAGMSFTKDGSMVAYQISEGGSDWRKIIVLNTKDKTQVGDVMVDIKFTGVAWKGNEGFYYSSYDKPKDASALSAMTQYHKLYYHKLGTAQKEDILVFGGEKMPRRYVGAYITEDQRYLVISAANSTSGNELYIQDLSKPGSPLQTIVGNFENNTSVIASKGTTLFLETNYKAPNQRVVVTDIANPAPSMWKDLIPETDNVLSVGTGGGKIFASYLKDATSYIEQYAMDGTKERAIELPGIGTASGFGAKEGDKELYFSFTSYTYPPTIFKYDIVSGKSDLYKTSGVKFDPAAYESKQVFYPSKDGTKIPMIITYKKGTKLDGSNPTMLYAYGGFNVSLTPSFSTSNIVLLEQGGVYAVANLRGGGEYGEKWHVAGTKLQKQNVFDDFIAAAEYLIANKYTSKSHLAISGGSNGGLLVGACMTQRPDLFKVAFPAVGVLDMLRYNKFTAGAGWAFDYGTAEDSKEMFEYLYKYSPYHALKTAAYPATMITTADHDDRVVPAHSFKFASRLQELHKGSNPVLIRIETNAGHGAGKSTAQIINEAADKWAFMFYNIGVNYKDKN